MHRLVHPVSSLSSNLDTDVIYTLSKFWTNVMGCVTSVVEGKEAGSSDSNNNDTYDGLSFICNDHSNPTNSNHSRRRRRCCIVHFQSGQELILEESDDAPPSNSYDIQNDIFGYHLCIYLPTNESFQCTFQQVSECGLLYANPRFAGGRPEFGNALDWKEASDCGQFRVKDWLWCNDDDKKGGDDGKTESVEVKSKVPLLVMELEVRSTSHICCPLK
uniref:Uncharacterized protein n=2 Tax=Ditylum brightwellii TaxID=49249 RepID=A0A7S1YSS7_9STRA|mmetsp:Transcript_17013/g.25238  ORF Transcript_17013/g.25238 Transcript_17013/m.25238 type:complete len:217 (+) Transcript_17013:527-1177(+)